MTLASRGPSPRTKRLAWRPGETKRSGQVTGHQCASLGRERNSISHSASSPRRFAAGPKFESARKQFPTELECGSHCAEALRLRLRGDAAARMRIALTISLYCLRLPILSYPTRRTHPDVCADAWRLHDEIFNGTDNRRSIRAYPEVRIMLS